MKKIFFVALSVILLTTACQKTEVINSKDGRATLSFSTGMSKLTKAIDETASDADAKGQRNLEAQDFSVWAYADPNSDFSTVTVVDANRIYDGIYNLLVECKEASVEAVADDPDTATDETVVAKAGKWETEKEYYWPGDAKDLRFFAVSADGDWLRPTAPGECPVEIDYEAPSLKIKDFIVRNTAANGKTAANEDLMVADFVKQNQSEKEVDLTFRHTLAKVEFVFKTLAPEANSTAPDVWVQSLSMGNLKNKGTLDVTAKSGETDVVWEYDWTPDQTATAVTFTDDWSESATYLEGSDSDVVADATAMKLTTADNTFATWLMMPQTIGETHMVNINYVINKRKFTAVFPLGGDSNTPITEWAVNQHIKYTVILAPNTITFVPTVLDWTTATSVEYQN